MSDQDFILVDEDDKEKSMENSTEKNMGNNTGGEDGQPDRDAAAESPSAGTVKDEIAAAEKKDEDSEDEYEKICFICHRPESVTGKMIELPNHITVCPDCMQKSFDAMTSGAVDLNRLMNTPGVQFLNLSDLENMQPRQQKNSASLPPLGASNSQERCPPGGPSDFTSRMWWSHYCFWLSAWAESAARGCCHDYL